MISTPDNHKVLSHWARLIRDTKAKVESVYYSIIDDLLEKIDDLEIKETPNFELIEFDFLYDWELGNKSSTAVYNIVKKWNLEDVSKKKLVRHLNDFMFKNEDVADIVKGSLHLIETQVMEDYQKYLRCLVKFFDRAATCDKAQIPMTWVQVNVKDGVIQDTVENITLNQVIRQLDNFVAPYSKIFYIVCNNVVCFEIASEKTGSEYHLIAGPVHYIQVIKAIFDIRVQAGPGVYEHSLQMLKNKIKENAV